MSEFSVDTVQQNNLQQANIVREKIFLLILKHRNLRFILFVARQ